MSKSGQRKRDQVIDALRKKIQDERDHVSGAGDYADAVYIGERIGQLQSAMHLIELGWYEDEDDER